MEFLQKTTKKGMLFFLKNNEFSSILSVLHCVKIKVQLLFDTETHSHENRKHMSPIYVVKLP